jgi:hypothetical protein
MLSLLGPGTGRLSLLREGESESSLVAIRSLADILLEQLTVETPKTKEAAKRAYEKKSPNTRFSEREIGNLCPPHISGTEYGRTAHACKNDL